MELSTDQQTNTQFDQLSFIQSNSQITKLTDSLGF